MQSIEIVNASMFRAWDKNQKKMFYSGSQRDALVNIRVRLTDAITVGVAFQTLMRGTEVKDKKDIQIFEGDFLCQNDFYGLVHYNPDRGKFVVKGFHDDLSEFALKGEVVGNFYENPFMLRYI